jgi:hypothetical protein
LIAAKPVVYGQVGSKAERPFQRRFDIVLFFVDRALGGDDADRTPK